MQVKYLRSYISSLKAFKKDKSLLAKIKETENIFIEDHQDKRLHYKKITCKHDKNRYSIRIINTQYRILFSKHEETAEFKCVCKHDEYQIHNKNC